MTAAQSKAEVVWVKDLLTGNGRVKVGNGAFGELPITWAARTERPGGKTSPEELIAAAPASCYAMALSATLARRGTPPERLVVTAAGTFEKVGEGWKITTMDLTVRGQVPKLNQTGFEEAARAGEQTCPVSNPLRNNAAIRLHAQLE